MIKEKVLSLRDFVVKNSKFLFPVLLVIVVAVIVFVALRIHNGEIPEELAQVNAEIASSTEETVEILPEDVPLEEDNVEGMYTLIATYYDAYANGNVETIRGLTNHLDETEEIKIPEMSQYVEGYPTIEIYTKIGPQENSWLTYVYYQMKLIGFEDLVSGMETFYVCTDENGVLYMNEGEVSDEELEYIQAVNTQDDVAELYNKVNMECSDTFLKNADLYYYIQEIVNDVQKTTGEILAAQNTTETTGASDNTDVEGTDEGNTGSATQTGPVYATATTTVNVRKSDSEIAEKITKVTNGTKVEVLEQKVNGWSKVRVDGKEGYIKSEYLRMAEVVTGEAIGTVTAKETVNVRMAASTDSEKLGVLAGGDTADLLEKIDDWCKINYNGSVGYVKAEFVQ